MASPLQSASAGADLFDSSLPFKGVVVCCTSIPPEQRIEIAQKAAELGGLHKYDLTPDVTHLIVGEYDTPKYRHVARERPDIQCMAAGWIEAVRDLWVQDAEIDFASLENAWKLKTFETRGGSLQDAESATPGRLLCCLTGFEDGDMRQEMIELITANGADYTGDLTRKVTHLIVNKPEGKKYAAAKSWSVQTVAVEWLYDSVKRGMILDEKCYDPVLPKEERGKGAWIKKTVEKVALGKRFRDTAAAAEEGGKRKLRKTASMKLSSQRDNMWGDILGKPPSVEPQTRPEEEPTQLNPRGSFTTLNQSAGQNSFDTQGSKLASFGAMEEVAVFASCCFYVHGFSPRKAEIVVNYISSLGGLICPSLDDVASNSGAQMLHRFMIVPQDALPDSYPSPPENIQVITEFFVEKCMHKKQFFDPASHVIGRPFPVYPIPGFDGLSISTAGFTGVDLNHMDRAIRQLGARYDERFKAQTSLLVCNSLSSVRKQKLDLALAWRVPVVSANWLWTCISDGKKVPIKRFLFKELRQRFNEEDAARWGEVARPRALGDGFESSEAAPRQVGGVSARIDKSAFDVDKPLPLPEAGAAPKQKPKIGLNSDKSAFAVDKPFPIAEAGAVPKQKEISKEDSDTTADFETAPTHLSNADSGATSHTAAPLSDASSSQQNRNPPPQEVSPTDLIPAQPPSATGNPPITNENMPPPQPDATKQKEAAEKEKAALKAAERLALTAQLTTLVHSPSDQQALPTVNARRRRVILGRAISNVSAASSASDPGVASAPADLLLEDADMEREMGSGSRIGVGGSKDRDRTNGEDSQQLSSTQLQYDDPEAEAQKERLKGGKGGGGGKTKKMGTEKLTLASAGGYEGGYAGAAAAGGRGVGGLRTRTGTGKR
ncbi:BRCT domain-containing protein [Coniochaeta sp. 2T2.1]|nr:BRCT domain-containing protein [Coniochaeta sp. 2T2.1]